MATYKPTTDTSYLNLQAGDIIENNYTGKTIELTVPGGSYKLECWGAQGGSGYSLDYGTTTTTSWTGPLNIRDTFYNQGNSGLTFNSTYTKITIPSSGYLYGHFNVSGEYICRYTHTGTYEPYIHYFSDDYRQYLLYSASETDIALRDERFEIICNSGPLTLKFYRKTTTTSSTSSWHYTTDSANAGGVGGYSRGVLNLTKPTKLYVNAGGIGASNSSLTAGTITKGGFNGGGDSLTCMSTSLTKGTSGGGGGGASDIRIGNNSLYSRVIVAGGGAGGATVSAQYRGGGLMGEAGATTYQASQDEPGFGGSFGIGASVTGNSGYGYAPGGGGGGWYGGGAASPTNTSDSYRQYNGGGSGYVYTANTALYYPPGCELSSKYYLQSTATAPIADNNISNSYRGTGIVKITCLDILPPPPPLTIKSDDTTFASITAVYIKTVNGWKGGNI